MRTEYCSRVSISVCDHTNVLRMIPCDPFVNVRNAIHFKLYAYTVPLDLLTVRMVYVSGLLGWLMQTTALLHFSWL